MKNSVPLYFAFQFFIKRLHKQQIVWATIAGTKTLYTK